MIPSIMGRHLSFMKGLVALYLIFLVVFFAAAPFLTLWLYAEADLSLTLLPQLIGFCLQGAFLVVVFAIYEKRTTLYAKRSHKLALRSTVSFLIRPLECAERQDMRESSSPSMVQVRWEVKERGLSDELAQKLVQDARMILVSLESLTILAAQIDIDHLDLWGRILNRIHQLTGATTSGEVRDILVELVDIIIEFDDLHVY
ncbi:MAG: hypothetical protein HQL84_04125 [Magnetococcales bacterium]|nr:hypothetical protein [Magnetococcales bacterium]MBF0149214.1 hypothetical protein [Magnetococcales bacterium]MBF0171980.1 hypothetical protein [Magnetococcales bacterium]MBF0349121.1 hypothetical protein [Magnetococcales bacterium]MBF0630562.1 hypothetical protein [Magnetococcales bacterium]